MALEVKVMSEPHQAMAVAVAALARARMRTAPREAAQVASVRRAPRSTAVVLAALGPWDLANSVALVALAGTLARSLAQFRTS